MQRKFILCLFRNGDFCLLIFFSIFLNIVYGWTAQNSAINSKNFVQRMFFELLCRVYKTPKFGGMYFMNVHPLSTYPQNFAVLYTLSSLVCMDTLLRTLSSIPQYQKKKIKEIVLFCFLPEKKSFVGIPRFWESRKSWQARMAVWEAQYLWLNIFWTLVGTIFFTMCQVKTKLKNVRSQTFF